MKKLLFFAIICIGFVSFTTIDDGLSDKDRQNSLFFKMSRNSNRLAIFEQLQAQIKIKSHKSKFAVNIKNVVVNFSSMNEVVALLGEPNVKPNYYTFVYTLNPSSGCKAIVEFDTDKLVKYIGIKDCN